MSSKKFFVFAIFLALCLARKSFLTNNGPSNDQPVIGVLTQPSDFSIYPYTEYSYIATPYIEFVEASGARALPIHHELPEDKLLEIFKGINGLIFPGGGASLWHIEKSQTGFSNMTKAGAFLLNLAIEANNNGDYFPVWGTCLGYELILLGVTNFDKTLSNFNDSDNHSENLELLNQNNSRIFKEFTDEELEYIKTEKPFFFNHEHGITPERFASYPALTDFFTITSTSTTKNGTVFVASVEAKQYPIYGTQFHPEKIPYVWRSEINVSHTEQSVVIEQKVGNFLNKEARKNFHSFSDPALLDSLLIYNFVTVRVPDSFMTCYFFKNLSAVSEVKE